ncbi:MULTISPECIES: hypothetical protein [Clostridium]|nr:MULTISPECIES: hypothetical protein [Clostridium]
MIRKVPEEYKNVFLHLKEMHNLINSAVLRLIKMIIEMKNSII